MHVILIPFESDFKLLLDRLEEVRGKIQFQASHALK
jgi:hypothetical protein